MVYVEQVCGPDHAAGRAFSAHATALGKALLAQAPASVLDELVLEAWTTRTITDRGELGADLALTRERGWALDDGELDLARRSIGAVVRDHCGVGHLTRKLPDARLPELAAAVVEQAAGISEALGGALGTLPPARLEVQVLGALDPPVPPAPRADTPEGTRSPGRSRANGV